MIEHSATTGTESIICRGYDSYKATAEGLILSEIELSVTNVTETIIGRRWESNQAAAEGQTRP